MHRLGQLYSRAFFRVSPRMGLGTLVRVAVDIPSRLANSNRHHLIFSSVVCDLRCTAYVIGLSPYSRYRLSSFHMANSYPHVDFRVPNLLNNT